jgi:hypothetical protein
MLFGLVSQNGNEPLCSLEFREFLDWLRNYQLQKRDSATQVQFVIIIITELGV